MYQDKKRGEKRVFLLRHLKDLFEPEDPTQSPQACWKFSPVNVVIYANF